MNVETQSRIVNVEKLALIVGAGALVLCIAGGLYSPAQFYRSYLFAFIFWLGVALGCILLMLHHLVGGGWGHPIRRML